MLKVSIAVCIDACRITFGGTWLRWTLTTEGARTRLPRQAEVEFKGGVLGQLLEPLFSMVIKKWSPIFVLDFYTMKTFTSSRWYSAQPEAVFHAIENPRLLARWWGPNGFTCTFEVFEFKVGGQWKFVMHGPDGTDYPNVNEFAVIEPHKVVIRHVEGHQFKATLLLSPENEGTRVDWEQAFEDEEVANSIAHVVKPSNEQLLDKLGKVLEEERTIERRL